MRFTHQLKYFAAAAFLCLPSYAALAAPAPAPGRPMAFYVGYELTLAANGTIEKLALRDKKLSPLITDFLEKSVRSWKFTPGSIAGVAQRTESALWLNVEAKPREDGNYELFIVDANTGSFGAISMPPPTYPKNELMSGREAVLRILVSYDENGVVTKVERVEKLGAREEKLMRPFEQASFSAAKKWRFNPEKVGGHGIAGTSVVPIKYCMVDTNCSFYLSGTKEKEKLARQLASQVLLGSSQVSIQRTQPLN